MSKIKTLVYFDLEATGLKSSGRPRISEISFLAVNSEDVKELHLKIQSHLRNKNNKDYLLQVETLLPRVLNKLSLCIYPMAIIMPEVSDITGLDNYNLTDQTRFDKTTGVLLNNFLERLPTPICLVAHNGNEYDFPLLKAEMEKVGIQLGSDILCADSYIGVKAIFQKRKETIDAEETEKQQKIDVKVKRNTLKSSNRYDPIQKKRLLQNNPQSFSLINLHELLLGCKPILSHGAEADCITLLRTTAALGKEWMDWMEKGCKLFNQCKTMWGWY